MAFEKVDGYFPYIELQSKPVDGIQRVYFDVLNWELDHSKYVTKPITSTKSFIAMLELHKGNQLEVLDAINTRLQAFYMMFKDGDTSETKKE